MYVQLARLLVGRGVPAGVDAIEADLADSGAITAQAAERR